MASYFTRVTQRINCGGFFPGDCPVWASAVGAAAAMQLALPVLFTVEPEEGTVPHPAGLLLRQRSQHEYSQGRDELEAHRRLSPRAGHRQKRAFGSAGSHEQQQLSTITLPHNIQTFRLTHCVYFQICTDNHQGLNCPSLCIEPLPRSTVVKLSHSFYWMTRQSLLNEPVVMNFFY